MPGRSWSFVSRLPLIITAVTFAALALGAETQPASIGPEGASVGASRAAYSEEQVKAAFLFNFAGYAQWPGDQTGPITFALLDASGIADELERFSRDRTIGGRTVTVRRIRSLDQLDGAQVLFIGSRENPRLSQIIRQIHGPTLVVTDAPDGLPRGAMINFQMAERRVRFEVALPAVQRAGLTLSSRLLSAALRVKMSRCHLECGRGRNATHTEIAAWPTELIRHSRA